MSNGVNEMNGLLVSELAGDLDMLPLVRRFVATLEERKAELEAALEVGNLDAARSVAHRLRGAGGGYGFPRITEAAAWLEDRLRAGADPPTARREAGALLALLAAARAEPPPRGEGLKPGKKETSQ